MADRLFLGERVDPATHERTGERVELDPSSLTTHGLVVGMTGSGKTGCGVVLIEEMLLAGIPVLVLDPKGDLANLALNFPNLSAEEFAPWVEGGEPAEIAERWRNGLAGWDMGPADVARLGDAADVTVYTPGSTAGVPVNVVGSLRRPAAGTDPEMVADEIEGFVSGLLGMVGIDADPLSSREHILLSNLVHHAWENGDDLDLSGLVGRIQQPPLRKLGVLDLESFFPADDRTKLAVRINGLLASPSFGAWAEGPPLAIDALLWPDGPSGRPGCAVVSLAHLSDDERQFVVSLVLGKLVTWMRHQSGTENLRAMLWFDEVMGFVPPSAVPPAKKPLLTLLKQARAFGLGVVLATQNPIDVDYKGISNAGTWAIGRLQTERDKTRLLEGMTSAAGGVDIGAVSDTVSGLDKREFVLRRPGATEPEVFTTRWALTYLRGPMTREQIAALGQEPPAASAPTTTTDSSDTTDSSTPTAAAAPAPAALDDDTTAVMPSVADQVDVRWLDLAAPWASTVGADTASTRLSPALALRLTLLYDERRLDDLRHTEEFEAIVHPLSLPLDPEAVITVDHDDRDLLTEPPDGASYVISNAPIAKVTDVKRLTKAVIDQLAASRTLSVPFNTELKLAGRPGEDADAFARRCEEAADAGADEAAAKLRATYAKRLDTAQDQVDRAAGRLTTAEESASNRRTSELVANAGSILGGLLGGRRSARSLARAATSVAGRRGRSREAASRVDAARNRLVDEQEDVTELETELADEMVELAADWDDKAATIETVEVPLEKTDIRVTASCVLWLPITS